MTGLGFLLLAVGIWVANETRGHIGAVIGTGLIVCGVLNILSYVLYG